MTDYTQLSNEALDALVAERVMGWQWGPSPDVMNDGEAWSEPRPDDPTRRWEVAGRSWSPASDIGAAWSVVEKMRSDGFEVDLGSSKDIVHTPGHWLARFWKFGVRVGPPFVIDASQTRAIVIAALQALDRAGGGE